MAIKEIEIYDDLLTLTLPQEAFIPFTGTDSIKVIVHIDELCTLQSNMNNPSSEEDVHTFTFEYGTLDGNKVTVQNDSVKELSVLMKYITVELSNESAEVTCEGIHYDKDVLYIAEMNKLRSYCSTCLDDKMMKLLTLVVYKRQLMENAIAVEDFTSAIGFYLDLCRLLGIDTCTCSDDYSCGNILTQRSERMKTSNQYLLREQGCTTCANGYCSIK